MGKETIDKVPKVCYYGDMKYRMRDKRDRNQRLIRFAQEHPDYTHQAIANIFHLDRSRVSRILKAKSKKVRRIENEQ